MITLAAFEFATRAELLSRDDIALLAQGDVIVRLFRHMRTTPAVGMKQPLLNSAIMGMEAVLELRVGGRPGIGYSWRLSTTKFIQRGRVDEHGRSYGLNVDLLVDGCYRLAVNEPAALTRQRLAREAASLAFS